MKSTQYALTPKGKTFCAVLNSGMLDHLKTPKQREEQFDRFWELFSQYFIQSGEITTGKEGK